jgi:hypothetical protein
MAMNTTPKRSVGVILTAVVSILGSALLLLLVLLMLLGALLQKAQQPGMPPYLKTVLLMEGLALIALAAWGIATAVGLFRLRRWARWSTIVFSVLLLGIGVFAALATAMVSFPPNPGAPPGMMAGVKVGIVCFYAVLALLGGFWLYYFHTPGVRAQFGAGTEGPGGRPLSLWVIPWFLLVGALFCLVMAFFPFPAVVFGLVVRGWSARLFFLAFAAIECWLGVGLLRLNPLSRILAIGLCVYGFVSSLLFAFLPGYPERVSAMMDLMPTGWPGAAAGQAAAMSSMQPGMVMGALACLIPVWFLVARRGAFGKPPGSEQIAGQQPL